MTFDQTRHFLNAIAGLRLKKAIKYGGWISSIFQGIEKVKMRSIWSRLNLVIFAHDFFVCKISGYGK